MSVIAQDPAFKDSAGNILMAQITVPAEELAPGPRGYRVQVVDYDATTSHYHDAHQIPGPQDQEPPSWRKGSKSILRDYRFHAQNVYALVMKTLGRFEFALGRRVGWSFDAHQLKIAPHGMLDANAFYSAYDEALVFGYFSGRADTIYTCLSHDIVVHETTHALVDALRERYLDPSTPDQGAFHEGFSDVIALLSVFSQRELVLALLEKSMKTKDPTKLVKPSQMSKEALKETALFGLAEQMGSELDVARGEALRRSAELPTGRTWRDDAQYLEPHRRGEILVAAVMNGFLDAWHARLRPKGTPKNRRCPLGYVAEEGAAIAEILATMWIRALDYMPPVHLEFKDALSAALTADIEVRPDDSRYELRKHMRDAFRSYDISPASKRTDGIWDDPPTDLRKERLHFESMRNDPDEVFRFIWENRDALKVHEDAHTHVLSVRPCVRTGRDGFFLRETVAEYYQVARLTVDELKAKGIQVPADYIAAMERAKEAASERRAKWAGGPEERDEETASDDDQTTPLYGGGALIFDEWGNLKYHIHNDVFGKRQSQRLKYLWTQGYLKPAEKNARLLGGRLSAIHRAKSLDARRIQQGRGW